MMHSQLASNRIEVCVKTTFDEEGAHNFLSLDFYDSMGNSVGWAICPHVAIGIQEAIQTAMDRGLVALSDCKGEHVVEDGGLLSE